MGLQVGDRESRGKGREAGLAGEWGRAGPSGIGEGGGQLAEARKKGQMKK